VSLPELVRRRAEKLLTSYCQSRVVRLEKPEVRLTWETLAEGYQLVEQFFSEKRLQHQTIARFLYQEELCQWSLHLLQEEHWRFCPNVSPSLDLQKLLDFVDADPFGQFWR